MRVIGDAEEREVGKLIEPGSEIRFLLEPDSKSCRDQGAAAGESHRRILRGKGFQRGSSVISWLMVSSAPLAIIVPEVAT